MIDVIHRACGQPAVRMKRMLQRGELLAAENFEHVDGSPAVTGEMMVCDSCQDLYSGMRLSDDGQPEAY